MVQVVHLAPGEQPDEERFILIERCAPGGTTSVSNSGAGIVVKVPSPYFKAELGSFRRMAEQAGMTKLFVKGAPSVPEPTMALSPWAA
jgi:hypothetical protein